MMPQAPKSTLFPYTTLFRSDLVLQPQLSGVSGADFTTRRQSIKAGRDVTLAHLAELRERLAAKSRDRKSTRLNSSHVRISYAVFCLKKKKDPKARLSQATHR